MICRQGTRETIHAEGPSIRTQGFIMGTLDFSYVGRGGKATLLACSTNITLMIRGMAGA